MKLGYTIIYVPRVADSLQFFEQAFGLERKFLHDSSDYGELKTGETTLAFASHALGKMNFPAGHVHASESQQPLGIWRSLSSPKTCSTPTYPQSSMEQRSWLHPWPSPGAKQSPMSARRTVRSLSYALLLAGEQCCLTPRSSRPAYAGGLTRTFVMRKAIPT